MTSKDIKSIKNVSLVPRDLTGGRSLEPGEVATGVVITDHERGQIEAGHLLALPSPGRKRSANTSESKE